MTRSKEAWFSEELLNARLSMQNMEGVSRETVGALVGLIDEAVVGKVSLWQRRIAELEADLAKYQACRVRDVDEKAWLSKRMSDLEAALSIAIEDHDAHVGMALTGNHWTVSAKKLLAALETEAES